MLFTFQFLAELQREMIPNCREFKMHVTEVMIKIPLSLTDSKIVWILMEPLVKQVNPLSLDQGKRLQACGDTLRTTVRLANLFAMYHLFALSFLHCARSLRSVEVCRSKTTTNTQNYWAHSITFPTILRDTTVLFNLGASL